MIQKKSFANTIKRALQAGQQAKQFPPQLFKLDTLPLQDQNWWDCVAITKMDFSNNQITKIPQNIMIFVDLQLLRMKNNLLQSLPACLSQLKLLKLLDLSKNKIPIVPKQYSYCQALVQLNLSQNLITFLPDLSSIKTLEHLIINDNKLKELPRLGQNLKKVEASTNLLTKLSLETFVNCSKLQSLLLNKNQIEIIQKGTFSRTTNMIMVQLKQNRLSDFSQMPCSQKLDTISLSFNRLSEFNDFDKCPNLSILILNDNKIKKISGDIVKLKKLKTLDLSNNDLPDLPSELGFIQGLLRLQIEGNPLKAIRQNIRAGGVNQIKKYLKDRMDQGQKKSLQNKLVPSNDFSPEAYWTKLLQQFTMNSQLMLKGMKLQQLHQIVFQKDLKVLNVTQNKLSSISQSVGKLSNLKHIYLNKNELNKLPQSLSILSHLELIEAQHNKLTDFCLLTKPFFNSLHHLDLSTNRIVTIPKSIFYLKKLRTLLLSYNKISSIDDYLNQDCLPFLEIFDVSNNQLVDISDSIFMKYSLNYLNLQNNNLSKLPTVLGFMKLLGLKVDGNPLKQIKRQVIQKGTVALMDFLRTKHVGDPPIKPLKQKIIQKQEKNTNYEEIEYHYPVAPTKQQEQTSLQLQKSKRKKQQQAQLKLIQQEIRQIQQQLQNNLNLNNFQKNQKKKALRSLIIIRNKLQKP